MRARSVPVRVGFWIAPWLLAAFLLPVPSALAQGDEDVARRAHAFARGVMSPYCPGRSLADCPSPDAALLRQQIRMRLAAGAPEDEVLAELTRRYGDILRPIPEGTLPWLGPIVLLAAGLGVLVVVLLRLSGGRREDASTAEGPAATMSGASAPGDAGARDAGARDADARDAIARELEAELESRGL